MKYKVIAFLIYKFNLPRIYFRSHQSYHLVQGSWKQKVNEKILTYVNQFDAVGFDGS